MKLPYKNILIINPFGIGDVLFSTPLLRAIKNDMPEARIDFVCNARTQPILQHNRNIDSVIVFEKDDLRNLFKESKARFVKTAYGLIKKIRSKKYDLVIDLSLGHQFSFFMMAMGISKRIGFNFRQRGRFLTDRLNINGFHDKHVVEYFLELLKLLDVKVGDDKKLELEVSPETQRWAEDLIRERGLQAKRLIALAPGGGKSWGSDAPYRRWNAANFAYTASELLKDKTDDIFFLIIGSRDDCYLCSEIEKTLKERALNLCGTLSLAQSASIIKRCELILCNDGGILHMAVSQKIKTVSIFGPVDDRVYGPYPPSGMHKVIKAGDVACRPCYKNFKYRACENHICLDNIDKDMVTELIRQSLGLGYE